MRIFLGSDHAGFELKNKLALFLIKEGHQVEDMGPHTFDPQDDYPDYILPVASAVAEDATARGIVLGASGQGEAIAANRVRGARAAVYYGPNPSGSDDQDAMEIIRLSREHNDANILSIGARFISEREAIDAVTLWLRTGFSGEERHVRRLTKLGAIEDDIR